MSDETANTEGMMATALNVCARNERCSFCGYGSGHRLIAGDRCLICEACATRCVEFFADVKAWGEAVKS